MLLSLVAMMSAAMGGMPSDSAIKSYPGGWDLYKNSDGCALMRSYDKDTTLHIAYYAGKSVRITILDNALRDVKDGSKSSYKLLFLKGDTVDNGWGSVSATGIVLSTGAKGFSFGTTGSTFLEDMGKNDLFGLMDGDKVVESLKLDQAVPAIEGLKVCSAAVN